MSKSELEIQCREKDKWINELLGEIEELKSEIEDLKYENQMLKDSYDGGAD